MIFLLKRICLSAWAKVQFVIALDLNNGVAHMIADLFPWACQHQASLRSSVMQPMGDNQILKYGQPCRFNMVRQNLRISGPVSPMAVFLSRLRLRRVM